MAQDAAGNCRARNFHLGRGVRASRELREIELRQLPQEFRRLRAFDRERACPRGFVGECGIVHDDEFVQNLERSLPQKRMTQHKQAILECQRDEFGQHVTLRIEQQPQRALAGREIADIPGGYGVEIAHAVRAGERENGAKIAIDQRDALARRRVFGERIAKLCRQAHAEIFSEFGTGRALRFEQRSFEIRVLFYVLFGHKN